MKDRARIAAPAIVLVASRAGFEPILLGAIALAESSLRPGAIGARGEVGLFQVLPSTARLRCRREFPNLADPKANATCAARLLKLARAKCGPDPANYLRVYNRGLAANCGASTYADKILALQARASIRAKNLETALK
jgi:soluble lytic murein transglycosylase-like protein